MPQKSHTFPHWPSWGVRWPQYLGRIIRDLSWCPGVSCCQLQAIILPLFLLSASLLLSLLVQSMLLYSWDSSVIKYRFLLYNRTELLVVTFKCPTTPLWEYVFNRLSHDILNNTLFSWKWASEMTAVPRKAEAVFLAISNSSYRSFPEGHLLPVFLAFICPIFTQTARTNVL